MLRDVSFVAPRGSVLALVGASGAGKSTLLRCLNRLTEATAGTVTLDGVDVRSFDPPTLRRRVALVAQAPVMLPGSVADNLAYGLAALAERDGVEALAAAGLDPSFLGRDAAALSGGERARVALARALTRDPDALLLDEPTAALDPDAAHVIAATIAALAARDLAVIVATHDATFASTIATSTLRLNATSPPGHLTPDRSAPQDRSAPRPAAPPTPPGHPAPRPAAPPTPPGHPAPRPAAPPTRPDRGA